MISLCNIYTYTHTTLTQTNIYIYIYMYIYSHPRTDCFIVSQLFIVARQMLQGGIKIRLNLEPASSSVLVKELFTYIFLHMYYRPPWVLNSWEELLHFSSSISRQISHKSAHQAGFGSILSSTDRLFHCIATLQCCATRWVLQIGIEIRLILPQGHHHSLH